MTITINGRLHGIEAAVLRYDEILRIARSFAIVEDAAKVTYFVHSTCERGELAAGDVIAMSDGLVLEVETAST